MYYSNVKTSQLLLHVTRPAGEKNVSNSFKYIYLILNIKQGKLILNTNNTNES